MNNHRQYNEGHVKVGDGHEIYYAEHGNPKGIPLLIFHGGPGGSSCPEYGGIADLNQYRLIRFDQRGTGRSRFFDQMAAQNIEDQVQDAEILRRYLNIDKWVLFGGSYGCTLSSYYRVAYSENVMGHIMMGMFFGDMDGTKHLTEGGGMASAYLANKHNNDHSAALKEIWDDYALFPQEVDEKYKNTNLYEAYYELMNHSDESVIQAASIRFDRMDTAIVTKTLDDDLVRDVYSHADESVTLTRLFFHYANHAFTEHGKRRIIAGLQETSSIPTFLIHGGQDHICPVKNAYEIQKHCPDIDVCIIPDGGHAGDDLDTIRAIDASLHKLAKSAQP